VFAEVKKAMPGREALCKECATGKRGKSAGFLKADCKFRYGAVFITVDFSYFEGEKMTKKNVFSTIALIMVSCILLVTFVSCTTFKASGLQYGLSGKSSGYEVLGKFSDKTWVNKFLGNSGGSNLFNLSSGTTEGDLRKSIEQEVQAKGGSGAINVEVKYGSNPLHWILNWITLGIWAPGTLTVTGTVVNEK